MSRRSSDLSIVCIALPTSQQSARLPDLPSARWMRSVSCTLVGYGSMVSASRASSTTKGRMEGLIRVPTDTAGRRDV
eukprot:55114-Eustigmatos_ZCMA.PRE.1